MTKDDGLTLTLTPTAIDPQDVKAEAALVELQTGKKPSLRHIYTKLACTDRVLYYGDYHQELDQAQLPWVGANSPDTDIVQRIIDWTLQRDLEIQGLVFSFLESQNKEKELPSLLKELGLEVTEEFESKPQRKTMADIMRDALSATKDELISLIQRVSPETKRPAATVRQFLRQETRKGKIYLGNDGRYHHV